MDISTAGADYTKEYTLDLVGNRTKLVETKEGQSPVTTTNTYNARDQLLTATTGATTITYSYDSNGSLIMQVGGGDTSTFDWDIRGRMIGATVSKSGTTTVAEYRYTPNGIRSSVTETVNGGQPTTTLHIIDTLGPSGYAQVVEERTGSGLVVASYVYGPGLDPLSQWRQGQGSNLYLADGHSGVRQAVDLAGAVLLVQRRRWPRPARVLYKTARHRVRDGRVRSHFEFGSSIPSVVKPESQLRTGK